VDENVLNQARAALRTGDAAHARALLEEGERPPEAWEILASASFVLLEFPQAIEEMERAYAGYRVAGDTVAAVRAARALAGMNGTTNGDWAIANGWLSRAKTLLDGRSDSAEAGWIALNEGMFSAASADRERFFREAIQVGHRLSDACLAFAASAYLGSTLVRVDRGDEGMRLLDEALAAVVGGEIDDFLIIEEIFCQLFAACEHAHDVERAEQWMRVGDQIAQRRRMPAVSAYCRTHYGGILTAAGRWPEADAALTEAVRLWALGRRTLKAGALARLADLRVRQGRYDEAAALLDGVGEHSDAARPLASLQLARGEHRLAQETLRRALRTAEPGSGACIPLLSLLVEAEVGAADDVRPTVDDLAACVAAHPSPYANAVLAKARAQTRLGDPQTCLHDAALGFDRAQLPLEAALCRLQLAEACADEAPDVAAADAREALAEFDRLAAARHADAATALLRRLGARVAPARPSGGALTVREQQVVELVGEGLTNVEIGGRLFISRKTVEHHVGNALAKLGLRNRAELAAYAVRGKPASR
jgi:DNA-binding CsgD family transcriptional regulator